MEEYKVDDYDQFAEEEIDLDDYSKGDPDEIESEWEEDSDEGKGV